MLQHLTLMIINFVIPGCAYSRMTLSDDPKVHRLIIQTTVNPTHNESTIEKVPASILTTK